MATEGTGVSATAAGIGSPPWSVYALAVLSAALILVTGADLWPIWNRDPSLGHAPLVPAIVLYHLWQRRAGLAEWSAASPSGAALLGLSAALFAGAYWADIEFLKPLSLIGMAFGVCWFLGGRTVLARAAGALGFLLFTIPWPAALVTRLQFPLQLTSSAYAAIFAGIAGIPVHRTGVMLSIVPDPARPPTYVILVAQQCSGLTSLIVLLALGYLVAYHTPVSWSKRALLFGITIPLALVANAVRLTFILVAGAWHGAAVAQWIHDHEQPVLIFACTLGLLVIRSLLLNRIMPAVPESGESDALESLAPMPPPARPVSGLARMRVPLATAAVALALMCGAIARRAEGEDTSRRDTLARMALPYQGWTEQDLPLTAGEQELLESDTHLLRRYRSPGGEIVELAVIAGHRKRTVHSPDACLAGGGWETISQRDVLLTAAGRQVPAIRASLTREGARMAATYFFTDGAFSTRSLPQLQFRQILSRLRGQRPFGAMVRILTSDGDDTPGSEWRANDFARTTLPAVFDALAKEARN